MTALPSFWAVLEAVSGRSMSSPDSREMEEVTIKIISKTNIISIRGVRLISLITSSLILLLLLTKGHDRLSPLITFYLTLLTLLSPRLLPQVLQAVAIDGHQVGEADLEVVKEDYRHHRD